MANTKHKFKKIYELPKIELLNSEGPIMTMYREDNTGYYIIVHEQRNELIAILNEQEVYDFVHGDLEITDIDNNKYKYGTYPGSMKPDLKRLDQFIRIDTTNKTY